MFDHFRCCYNFLPGPFVGLSTGEEVDSEMRLNKKFRDVYFTLKRFIGFYMYEDSGRSRPSDKRGA